MKTYFNSLIVFSLIFISMFSISYAQQTDSKTAVIKIKTSAVCGTCKEKIEKNLIFEKGVTEAVLDLETKIVTVTYRPSKTDPDKIRLAISKLGYDADSIPADSKAYEKLPACCKKDAAPHH